MGIKIGEVDVASQIIESEYRIAVLEGVIDMLIQRFPTVGSPISEAEMGEIRRRAVKQLQTKYPNSGINLKGDATGGKVSGG